jgi:hypothetical protein
MWTMLLPMVSARLLIVSEVGYCPEAMRDLKESTKSLRTEGIWLAWATRLEKEAAEVVKFASDCSVDAGVVAGADVVDALIGETEEEVREKLLICISLSCFIGPMTPLLNGFLISGDRLIRFTGQGKFLGEFRR